MIGSMRCTLSLFYIKPQRKDGDGFSQKSCTLSLFYIKPQRLATRYMAGRRCTLSLFYIKPQLQYRGIEQLAVVPYHFSTSNHNSAQRDSFFSGLYLITFLHQTTTCTASVHGSESCTLSLFYIKPQHEQIKNTKEDSCTLSLFYIKPQPPLGATDTLRGCTLSLFYIKPQRCRKSSTGNPVVPYHFSTSNHNVSDVLTACIQLYLITFLHQTTTCWTHRVYISCCTLSLFYIKPQPQINYPTIQSRCTLSLFYIKPQLTGHISSKKMRCTLSLFYIKPQPIAEDETLNIVVPYHFSTSNHNYRAPPSVRRGVVPYHFSTSNHNICLFQKKQCYVVPYHFSTSNHNVARVLY